MIEEYSNLKKILRENGFVVVKNFFSDKESDKLRELAIKHIDSNTDIFSIDEIREYLLTEKYLKLISNIFDKDIIYWGNSSIYGAVQEKVGSFHEDARGLDSYSYNGIYPIYRTAIFFQDHVDFSGGIKFRIGSHRKTFIRYLPLYNMKKFFLNFLNGEIGLKDIFFKGKILNIRSKKNDLIIWNMKLHHCGRFKLLKLFPNFNLSPIMEKILPNFFFKKYEKKRLGFFIAYGCNSEELNNFIKDDYQRREKFFLEMKSIRNESFIDKLKKFNIGIYK